MKIEAKNNLDTLVVLHGWGMNQYAWNPVRNELNDAFNALWLDLPGHGEQIEALFSDLHQVTQQIANIVPDHSIILGWSMGGLVAQQLAHDYPNKVKALLLTNSTPCFCQQTDWKHAMEHATLDTFAQHLEKDYELTIKRFTSLQFLGVKQAQKPLKQLTENILKKPASMDALQKGLKLLKFTDLRNLSITCPIGWIFGDKDRLVPIELANHLKTQLDVENNTSNHVYIIPGAGHAPFISHPQDFVKIVKGFVNA